MSAINERNISRFLRNPFAVYLADYGDEQPSVPSFYTEPNIGLSFNKEFTEAKAYGPCNGILYTVRQDLTSFDFRASFSIKETTINGLKFAHGGTVNSDEDEIYLTGLTQNYAVWLETCFNDDNKIVRIKMPKAKNVDPQEVGTGEGHVVHPNVMVALVDPADTESFPSIYIQQ